MTTQSTNRLAGEKSPYLLQHQHNPVDWYPWGDEAFGRARREGKPIFLSIGYSTCHWCHVMERESFEDPGVADRLNAHFVSVKVDREERPDIDRIYMAFVQATTGQGGWPLNVFLTPDLKPFYGGTYFPPESRHGRPGLPQVLEHIGELWAQRQPDIVRSALELHRQLEQHFASAPPSGRSPTAVDQVLSQATATLKAEFDPVHGGFGGAPKFPRPSHPSFLLRRAIGTGDPEALRMVVTTCDRMAGGGIRDQLGGGFARYAVDAQWLVPHFEKMLYDNAQLANLYLDTHLATGDGRHADVVHDILRYVLRDLTHPWGGFYSAEDADSEGHEGKFYCWTRQELAHLLTPEEFLVATRYYGVTEAGNFVDHSHPRPLPGQNVLSIAAPDLQPADRPILEAARAKLLEARGRRVRPHLDDKVLTSWNGLMLGAVARAGAALGDDGYAEAAGRNLVFLQAHLWDPATRTLFHRWRDGAHDTVQLLSGYANLLCGVIDFYEATLRPEALEFALQLAEQMIHRFFDPVAGGFFQSEASRDLLLRLKDDYDGAEPSGNSAACLGLLRLSAITGRPEHRAAAEQTLQYLAPRLQQLPQALPHLLCALDFARIDPTRIVIAGDPEDPRTRRLRAAAWRVYLPNRVILGTQGPVDALARSLSTLAAPAGYVCTGQTCKAPAETPAALEQLLRDSS